MQHTSQTPIDPELVSYLSTFVTQKRRERMEQVLARRTRYLTVVIEDIYQPHNASAVLRSCDGFGIQDVHIIENRNEYRLNPQVELGTAQWLSLHRYRKEENNTPEAISRLREAGYRIVATSSHSGQVRLEDFDLDAGRTAILLGNELDGLSESAITLADEYLTIPMEGFVESFNISVSAAVILHHLSHVLRNSTISWQLSEGGMEELRLGWLRASLKRWRQLEEEFYRNRANADET